MPQFVQDTSPRLSYTQLDTCQTQLPGGDGEGTEAGPRQDPRGQPVTIMGSQYVSHKLSNIMA